MFYFFVFLLHLIEQYVNIYRLQKGSQKLKEQELDKMPMKREDHESLLGELVDPNLAQERRLEILTSLRTDYTGVIDEHSTNITKIDKLEAENKDFLKSHAQLFRKLGSMEDPELQKTQEQTDLAETITLEDIEKGVLK